MGVLTDVPVADEQVLDKIAMAVAAAASTVGCDPVTSSEIARMAEELVREKGLLHIASD